jgi:RimJ/RimL family protein N-acetyltransferase
VWVAVEGCQAQYYLIGGEAMQEILTGYRNLTTLPDGLRVLLRPLVPGDKDQLVNLFAYTTPEDLRFLQDDVTDKELVASWADNLDYSKVFPLVAIVNNRLIGEATLHFGKGPKRHLAWVRIYVGREFRRRGIGTQMLKALIEIARRIGVEQLIAEVVTVQSQVVHAFEDLGFRHEFTYRDHFMTREGEAYDVAVLILRLVEHKGEF